MYRRRVYFDQIIFIGLVCLNNKKYKHKNYIYKKLYINSKYKISTLIKINKTISHYQVMEESNRLKTFSQGLKKISYSFIKP